MEEQYVLRWHYHESTLCKSLPFLLDSDILTDCTLTVAGKSFKAHRLVLATCSPYFLEIFQNTGVLELPIVILHNTNSDDVEAILSYMYRGQCLVTNEQLPRLLSLAKTLKIQGLCNMKVNELKTVANCDESNCDKDKEPIDFSRTSECGDRCAQFKNDDVKNYVSQDEVPMDDVKREYFYETIDAHAKKIMRESSEICKCFVCGKYLSNQYNLRVHMETHKDTYYSCTSCPHVSKSRDALRKHVSYRHPHEYTSRKRKKQDTYV